MRPAMPTLRKGEPEKVAPTTRCTQLAGAFLSPLPVETPEIIALGICGHGDL